MKLKAYLRVVTLALLLPMLVLLTAPALAATLPNLGTAASFGVLAGSTVTNTGATHVIGDVGVSPGSAITGFPPGTLTGSIHAGDAVAQQAQTDVTAAYNDAAGQTCNTNLTGQDLGGKTLISAVYCFDTSAQLTGQLTLDGQGNPASVFIFQIGSTLTTASNSSILLINGAQACDIFWQIGSSATLGTSTNFKGNILALTSITLNTTASSAGGLYARNGAVTLDSNNIQACGRPSATNTPLPTTTNTPAATSTTVPTATNTLTPTSTTVLSATNTPAATNTPTPTATNTRLPGATSTPIPRPTPPLPTNTPIPGATNTSISGATSTPVPGASNTPVPGASNTPMPGASNTPMPGASNTPMPGSTSTPMAGSSSTPMPGSTSTPMAGSSSTPVAVTTSTKVPGVTNSPTPTATPSTPHLPNTGSSLPWASPLVLLLGVLLVAAGLRLSRRGEKRTH